MVAISWYSIQANCPPVPRQVEMAVAHAKSTETAVPSAKPNDDAAERCGKILSDSNPFNKKEGSPAFWNPMETK
jgi:hypothetical protein